MKLVHAKLLNYKSIIETDLDLQSDITCLVGMTGAGKTSVLELLSKIDESRGFTADDLPVKSDIVDKFQKDEITADKIEHLIATFEIEESDRKCLPDGFDNLARITLTRFFDGGWKIDLNWSGKPRSPADLDMADELARIEASLAELDAQMDAAQSRIPVSSKDRTAYDKARQNLSEHMKDNPDDIGRMVANLKNSFFSIGQDEQLRSFLVHTVADLESASRDVSTKLRESRKSQIYEILPRPEYIPRLSDLEDKMPLDEYLNDPARSNTFEAIGLICGFNKAQLNNIRNSEPHTKTNYFEDVSSTLTHNFAGFWSQAKYDLKVELDGNDLVFSVKDKKSDLTTKSTQCSEGLKWVLALFFKIRTLASSRGNSHILLFDSPATAVHDAGKEEIRKFLTKVSEKHRIQIVYATHERALVDTWHLERIRFVSKDFGSGTKISEVKSGGIDTTRIEISKHIGSPAKYSLFGAPMIIHFEGRSDYMFAAALNEHAKDSDRRYLNPDLYSLDDLGGIDNSRHMMKICEDLGLDFCFVVDGGSKSKALKRDLGDKFHKHFVEISDVVGKDVADIEDIIDYRLYRRLFGMRYPDLLPPEGDVPANGAKKRATYYQELVKKAYPESRLDKGGISKYLVSVIKDTPEDCDEPLKHTMDNFEKLVDLIEYKLSLAGKTA